MCDRTKCQQNRPNGFVGIAIFRFSRWPPSAILDFEVVKFLVNHQTGRLICIILPNFTKIGQMIAEISHLTIFKMAADNHRVFLKVWYFDQLVSFGRLICAIVQNFVKIGQTVSEISRFFIFKMAAVRHLGFWNFEIFGWSSYWVA